MFFVGEKPWHGLGTELDHPATAVEAIEAAKLNYLVGQTPIQTAEGKVIPRKYATVNLETGEPLGIVGENYQIIQNVEAFSFFDVVVGEGQAIYHTAGALGKGERIWLLAKLPKDMVVAREDVVEKYIALTTSHDGLSSLKAYFTPVRVVCQNTLTASLRDAKDGISIRHCGDIKGKIDEARRVLNLSVNYYEKFEQIAKQMVNVQLNAEKVNSYFDKVLGADVTEESSTRLQNQKDTLVHLFEYGKGNDRPDVRHTLWAGYNAVTEYADHYRAFKNEGTDGSLRLKNIWFGSSAQLKDKAFKEAVSLVGLRN